MIEKYTYLIINIGSAVIPLLFSFNRLTGFGIKMKKALVSVLIPSLLFIPWDILFTRSGVWSFNENKTLGYNIQGIPFEEILFFVCIPFACLFTYNALSKLNVQPGRKTLNVLIPLAVITLLAIAIGNSTRLYTSITFFLSAILISYFYYLKKAEWFGRFIFSYFILLIPFVIVNGLLTGSFGNAAVVLYNNEYNLGIRLLSIPVEDFVYAFSLILLTVASFESKLYLHEEKDPRFSI